jgi:hypothetical protein
MPRAQAIDTVLYAERPDGRRKRLHVSMSRTADLPDGAMVLQDGVSGPDPGKACAAMVVSRLWYSRGASGQRPLITPPSTVAVLSAGYRAQMLTSAFGEWNPNADFETT